MSRNPKQKLDDPDESKRFIDMAREVEADESAKGREAFERAFKMVVSSKRSESGQKKQTPRHR